jgi:hypothetical protein
MPIVHHNRSTIDPNKKLIVYTHQGLGDIICCYAIIKTIIEESYGDIIIPGKKPFLDSLNYLYNGESRLSILPITDTNIINIEANEVYSYAEQNNLEVLQIGFGHLKQPFHYNQFFDQVNIPYRRSWEIFPEFKSSEHSKKLYDSLSLDNKDYILEIDSNTSGTFKLKIDSDLPRVKMFKTDFGSGIFDWIDVIINAKEIHTVGTGAFHLIDRIENFNKDCELYFHNVRHDFHTIDTNWTWNLIDYE